MGKFTLSHEIRCDEARFWESFFDDGFNEQLFREALRFDYKLLENSDREREIVRRYTTTPKLELPGPVAKLVGPNLRVEEQGRYDKAQRLWTWRMIPSVLADKFHSDGKMYVEAIGTDRVRRVAEMSVEVKIFGLGGLMESTAEKAMRDAWNKTAVFHNQWLEKNKKA